MRSLSCVNGDAPEIQINDAGIIFKRRVVVLYKDSPILFILCRSEVNIMTTVLQAKDDDAPY